IDLVTTGSRLTGVSRPMSFCDHIRACNNFDSSRVIPLTAGNARIGLLRRDNAEALQRFSDVFTVAEQRVELIARGDIAAVSRAVDAVVDALVAEHHVPKWRNESFDVAPRWGATPVFRLDRGAVPFFGTRAYGVHLNGYLRRGETLYLWVGARSPGKAKGPNKPDNSGRGGNGNGYGGGEQLLKEGEEEAAVPRSLISRAISAGAVSYRMETRLGIRDDVLFVYDLEMPAD